MPCSKPPLDKIKRAQRDERVAAREVSRAGLARPREPHRRPRRADEHDDRAETAADAGQRARKHTEVVLADGNPGDGNRAVHRRREHHADREAGEHEQGRAHVVAGAPAHQDVDGAEREPRHVDHCTQQEERPERAAVPAGGGAGGERGRGEREQGQGHGPGALVRRFRPRPAHGGGLGEHRGDRGGDEGETGDHERLRAYVRKGAVHTLRTRSQGRYPAKRTF